MDIRKNLFDELCNTYVETRSLRHQMMEKAHMDKFDSGLYESEVKVVKMAYDVLGFHEVTAEENGNVRTLIANDMGNDFSIPTEQFIQIMKRGGDLQFREAAWNALLTRNFDSLKTIN